MGDPLASAVASAIGAVAAALPSLSVTMTAGDMEGRAAICSSADEGIETATTGSVGSSVRVCAKVADFPRLAASMPVDVNGVARIVVALKNTGNAAWFATLSRPLSPVVFRIGHRSLTVMCAVADELSYSTGIGISSHSVAGDEATVFVPVEAWSFADPPRFGIRCTFDDGRVATIQAVEKMPYAYRCSAVVGMREGDR